MTHHVEINQFGYPIITAGQTKTESALMKRIAELMDELTQSKQELSHLTALYNALLRGMRKVVDRKDIWPEGEKLDVQVILRRLFSLYKHGEGRIEGLEESIKTLGLELTQRNERISCLLSTIASKDSMLQTKDDIIKFQNKRLEERN